MNLSMSPAYSMAQFWTVTWLTFVPVILTDFAFLRDDSPLNRRSTAIVICSGVARFRSKPKLWVNRRLQSRHLNCWNVPFLSFLTPSW